MCVTGIAGPQLTVTIISGTGTLFSGHCQSRINFFRWYGSRCKMPCHFSGLRGIYSPVSVDYLPRDAMRKRGLCCRQVSVRLSVCPSVTFVHCIQTAEDIVKPLSRPCSAIVLVFLNPSARTQFQGEPFRRAQNTQGVGKIRDFRLKSPFISETVRDRSMVTMERS